MSRGLLAIAISLPVVKAISAISKIACRLKIAMSRTPLKRVERVYPAAVRAHYVDLMRPSAEDPSRVVFTPRDLASTANAPPYTTLTRWRREFSHPRVPARRKGRICKLTLDEREVMAGYALYLLKRQHIVDHHVLVNFVSVAFNKQIEKSWVSRHMHKLGFSSHRPAGQPLKYFNKNALPAAIQFVEETRPVLNAFNDKSRIVAVDQISFWDNGLVTSCYAPIGR